MLSPDADRAALAAMRALSVAIDRHDADRARRDEDQAFASLVECTWWIASLDTRLSDKKIAPRWDAYRRLRDRDSDGQYVLAVVWARDKHYHQLPFTIATDRTPFFPGPPFHISLGLVWRPPSELHDGPDQSPPGSRARYAELLVGHRTSEALHRSKAWFDKITGDFLPTPGR